MVKVLVSGANGRMGREVLKAVSKDPELKIVATVDIKTAWEDVGEILGLGSSGVKVENDLEYAIKHSLMVDFTQPKAVMGNIMTALKHNVIPIVGTTGITPADVQEIRKICEEQKRTCFICPNFSIGAVLMMRFSQEAARYLPHVEIIEMHHDQKLDAPSGTATRTAEMILENRGNLRQGHPDEEEKLTGARGASMGGIPIHSVRLPGYVAHQEVIFGGIGQTLSIRHDSLSRESFMPGVVLACRRIVGKQGLVIGLEHLMD
jgi:4-hydroxy-tetrahydrodipicolinate reductase